MALTSLSSRAIRGYLFHELKNVQDGWVGDLAGPVLASDQESETYIGSGNVAGMRKWVGQRFEKTLQTWSKTVVNDKYEDTLYVFGEEWRRDKTGQVQQRISDLVQRYNQHWMELAASLLVTPGTAYDGVAFFSASHTEQDSGTQSNVQSLTAATGTTPTAQEMVDGIMTTISGMWQLKDNVGKPINVGADSFSVMVPPQLYPQLVLATGAQLIGNGSNTNTNAVTVSGLTIKPVVNPYLTAATKMYIYRNTGRAFIRQQEWGPEIQSQAEGSAIEMNEDRHVYGVSTSRGIDNATWQHIVECTWT